MNTRITAKNDFRYLQDWTKFDEQKFKNEFTSIDWDKTMMVEKNDPDLAFNGFYRKMMNLLKIMYQEKR